MIVERLTIDGLDAEARKTFQYIDRGVGRFIHTIPTTYNYEMTVFGDAGEKVTAPFDGNLILWQRVSGHPERSEYVGVRIV